MGTMCDVFVSGRQFRVYLWLYAIGLDTYLVSLFRFSKTSLLVSFRFFNQPMFQFNQEYGFSIMNFVVAGLCTLLLLAPIACIIRERQMRNLSAIGCDLTCSKKTNVVSPENEITTAAQ